MTYSDKRTRRLGALIPVTFLATLVVSGITIAAWTASSS
jgi:hypothetical protein